jgi:hypothetical protein
MVEAKMTVHNLTELDFALLRLPQGIVDMTWKETVHLEAKYFAHLGTGDEPTASYWKQLADEFDCAIETKWY